MAGAITGGDLIVANCNPEHLGAVIAKLEEPARADRHSRPDSVRVRSEGRCARPTFPPKSTPASLPTCRRSTWRWPRRPRA
jgi:UDP-N-acetylglucosamine enolpyruvyl transferase